MKEFSIAIPYEIDQQLQRHLIIGEDQEELTFALWYPSKGGHRFTSLIHSIVLPEVGDRELHGNVSFNPSYFKRVCQLAMKQGCGIALLHSHPGYGWQRMSSDDVDAELKLSGTTETLTNLPLVGLTISQDAVWSGRIWTYSAESEKYERTWAANVRVVGKEFRVSYTGFLQPKVEFREHFKRTVNVWGKGNHEKLARLRIGVVGLGSVGSIVAEMLARMGMQNIYLIDFDTIETHNLDRLIGATAKDIGKKKVDVIRKHMKHSATAKKCVIKPFLYSIAEEKGYRAAMDCDVLFSCVDKPRARYILNHLAYNHLIPVIDGGIQVRFSEEQLFAGAEWQVQTVTPNRICLHCLRAYDAHEVALEKDGLLEDPSYIKGLPKEEQRRKNNENIFPFSANLASMEIFHLIALVTGIGTADLGVQRYRFNNGFISSYHDRVCMDGCFFVHDIACGDKDYTVFD
jgi:molybdopterin-synthase adenylyltransferase